MDKKQNHPDQADLFNVDSYRVNDLNDEITADGNCRELLKIFHKSLVEQGNIEPLEAGSHARGADYFLRDYMIDRCRRNILTVSAGNVAGFAGNWYIVNTLEPNMKELESLLNGIRQFYLFCSNKNILSGVDFESVEKACTDLKYYHERIEAFHNLKENAFQHWNDLCPIQ